MLMINLNKDEAGNTWYTFEARGTSYDVRDNENGTYEVWSKRKAASFGPKAVILTLTELKSRAKVLRDFANFVTSEAATV